MAFHVGQKVVCISEMHGCFGHHPVVKVGSIYTIAGLTDGKWGLVVTALREVAAPDEYCGWLASTYFRPAVEKKTDISIFTDMLNRVPENAHT